MYRIERSDSLVELFENGDRWDALAGGIPFRETSWLKSWWSQFARDHEAYVLVAHDARGCVCGLMPFYRNPTSPSTLCFLGGNNACSDFTSVLAKPDQGEAIAGAMATFLIAEASSKDHAWERIEIDGVSDDDRVMKRFAASLQDAGAIVHAQSRMHTWLLECSESWDAWLGTQSRRTRRKHRLLGSRVETTEGMHLQRADRPEQLRQCLNRMIDLHQRRWNAVGKPGSYADPNQREFIHAAAADMLARDRLHLLEVLLDGECIGSSLNFVGANDFLYVYSTGYDPKAAKYEPGKILSTETLKYAHQHQMRGVDFLRGDEPYKKQLGATPTRMLELRIVAPRWWAKVCHNAWAAQFELKQWARRRSGRDVIEVVDMALTS
ncbi:GNAT family N-acetyltransferase [Novipirellula artificiosorum]|uniref:BioF2-like acetyltransferase domain-containing protein n=1 Tax=Novipirellula artificiosorum TaxID=2528016 RepID=A0A5C6DH69_9BACT|nr:GNAT family N-acetyltransferase [Novipirellula artificiosorum]TWU35932.1 hypothetical protein Poly41_36840 [Novipirellula artificiosorum]